MVDITMPRIQEVLLPYLRDNLPGVQVVSWVPDIPQRQFPLLNIRRLGGLPKHPRLLDRAVIEMTCYGDVDLASTENIFLDARTLVWDLFDKQIVTPKGTISSYFETMGPSQFDSPFEDTWRVQSLTQLGMRPPRNS